MAAVIFGPDGAADASTTNTPMLTSPATVAGSRRDGTDAAPTSAAPSRPSSTARWRISTSGSGSVTATP